MLTGFWIRICCISKSQRFADKSHIWRIWRSLWRFTLPRLQFILKTPTNFSFSRPPNLVTIETRSISFASLRIWCVVTNCWNNFFFIFITNDNFCKFGRHSKNTKPLETKANLRHRWDHSTASTLKHRQCHLFNLLFKAESVPLGSRL